MSIYIFVMALMKKKLQAHIGFTGININTSALSSLFILY